MARKFSHNAFPNRVQKVSLLYGQVIAVGLLLCAILLICGMGGRPNPDIASRESGAIMDLKAVYDLCRPALDCDITPDWEGQVIAFSGYVDPDNIYFRATHPQLPYEKFVVIDNLGRAIEVWPQGSDNSRLYAKLFNRPKDFLVVSGRLKSFKMPVGDSCTHGVKVVIDDVDQIQFFSE